MSSERDEGLLESDRELISALSDRKRTDRGVLLHQFLESQASTQAKAAVINELLADLTDYSFAVFALGGARDFGDERTKAFAPQDCR